MATHTHPCEHRTIGCTNRIECAARIVWQDGVPDRICRAEQEQPGGGVRCVECTEGPWCADCGWPAHLGHASDCDETAAAETGPRYDHGDGYEPDGEDDFDGCEHGVGFDQDCPDC